MANTDPLRAAALTLLADIAASRDSTSIPEADRVAVMAYLLDLGWIGELSEITPAGRAALAA